MMARGFKPVGWVAGVAAAALSCYMLSLNVAAERAELAKLEWRIVSAKRDIRALQTELGTRGRLAQLENWNANVLALSAPTANQFLDNEVTLARFDQSERTLDDGPIVQMASAETVPAPRPKIEAPVHYASATVEPKPEAQQPLVHRASLVMGDAKPAPATRKPEPALRIAKAKKPEPKKLAAATKPAPEAGKATKKPALIDDALVSGIREAAKAEGSAGGQ